MVKMAFLKSSQVMLMALFVGIILLMSSEVATATTQLKFGRRVLGVPNDDLHDYPIGYPVGKGGYSPP